MHLMPLALVKQWQYGLPPARQRGYRDPQLVVCLLGCQHANKNSVQRERSLERVRVARVPELVKEKESCRFLHLCACIHVMRGSEYKYTRGASVWA